MSTSRTRAIWLDVDPGHDDATAILLAVQCENVDLLGVSTVHGNASADNTMQNAARCLHAFGASKDVKVFPGAEKPLLRTARHDPEIHGIDGLGGVVGLPDSGSKEVVERYALGPEGKHVRALDGMADAIAAAWDQGKGRQVTVVSCGPLTNIALFVSVYPELLEVIEEFVFMGGGVGIGNRSAVAEFNILCDPEAAQIVLNLDVPKTMVPLNVTHTAIVTKEIHSKILSPSSPSGPNLPPPASNLRYMLSTLISFFSASYESTFGFKDGPPLHDALTIAYVAHPELFGSRRNRVDVELNGAHSAGETIVDIWNYKPCDDSWASSGRNCRVLTSVNVPGFFELFLTCIARSDGTSPLNNRA